MSKKNKKVKPFEMKLYIPKYLFDVPIIQMETEIYFNSLKNYENRLSRIFQ